MYLYAEYISQLFNSLFNLHLHGMRGDCQIERTDWHSTFADKSGIDVSLCLTFYYTKIKTFSIISLNINLVNFKFRQCFSIKINIKWKRKKEEETRNSPNLVSKIFNIFGYFCTSTLHVIKFLMLWCPRSVMQNDYYLDICWEVRSFFSLFCLRDVV